MVSLGAGLVAGADRESGGQAGNLGSDEESQPTGGPGSGGDEESLPVSSLGSGSNQESPPAGNSRRSQGV